MKQSINSFFILDTVCNYYNIESINVINNCNKAFNCKVRQVYCYLSREDAIDYLKNKKFAFGGKLKEMIDYLKSVYKIDNLTDTVFKAVENEYNNSKANT